MRRFAALGSAGLALFVMTAVAMAGSATSPSGQTQTLEATHSPNKAGKPAFVVVTVALSKADGSKATPTTEADVHLPKGMGLNYRKFPKCDINKLRSTGPDAACKKAKVSVDASSSAKADARPVVPTPVNATVQAFNGKKPNTYILYAVPELGPVVTLEGTLRNAPEGPYGYRLDIPVPLVPTLPGQPNATITYFQVKSGGTTKVKQKVRGKGSKVSKVKTVKVPYLVNPKTCTGTWEWRIDFTYENGEKLQPTDSAPCTK